MNHAANIRASQSMVPHLMDELVARLAAASRESPSNSRKSPSGKNLESLSSARLRWHIEHTLSGRQKQVICYYLTGKKEREIARLLGIRQQVVNIYKHRAIRKLVQIFSSNSPARASMK